MGFFDKLLSDKSKTADLDSIEVPLNISPCGSVQELIERYGGIALERQNSLYAIVGDNDWRYDINKGEINFGEKLTFRIQILGTFSHSHGTWLWAWANDQSKLPKNIIRQSLQLKRYGEDNKIDLLRKKELKISETDIHAIGLIALGVFDLSGYYIADYGQGLMVVTIKDESIEKEESSHHSIMTVFPQLISTFEINHKTALINYLKAKNYTIADGRQSLSAVKGKDKITAVFDESSRLAKLN